MTELKSIETVSVQPFRKLVLTIGELPSAFVESMSYYECLAWMVNWLENTVIPTINNNAEATEELQNLFIQLQNYVDDYFANLDVQEEINNKLDQMSEDGTLQEIVSAYLNTRAIFAFDTVAEMKAASNLVAGSYARTLGYYSRYEKGGGLYKIVSDENLTDDGGSVIELNNGLKATLVVENKLNVAQFGIDSTHIGNLANLCQFIESAKITNLEFNATTYPIDRNFVLNVDKLTLEGNGCVIEPSNTTGDFTIFKIHGNNVTLKNFVVDGKNIPQDQWSITSHSELVLRRCFDITAEFITCEKIAIKNVWGEGIMCRGYNFVKITDCNFNKIGGGFYKTDTSGANDYFGDGLYFSGHENDANVVIENCFIEGYQETGNNSRGSRCGIVFENLENYTIGNTDVAITNVELIKWNRAFHIEAFQGGQLTITCTNCNVYQDCSIAIFTSRPIINLYNSTVTQSSKNYNGSAGFAGIVVNYHESQLTIEDGGQNGIGQNGTIASFYNSSISGIKNTQMNNCTAKFINSQLYFDNTTNYTIYSSNVNCENCDFYNSATELRKFADAGSPYKCKNCRFHDIYPYIRCDDISNTVFLTAATATNSDISNPGFFGMCTVYVNNGTELFSIPNISRVFDATNNFNVKNTYVRQSLPADATLPIIPSEWPNGFKPKLNRRYALLIIGTTDAAAFYNYAYDNFYYTELKFNNNGIASVTPVKTVGGPAGEGHQLAFDDTAGTISRGAQYSQYVDRVIYRIIPWEWLSSVNDVDLSQV